MTILLGLFLACIQTAPPLDSGAAGSGDAGTTDDCDTQVVEAWPADRAEDVWLSPELVVRLDPPDDTARVKLVDADGAEVPASAALSEEGARWTLSPDAPLAEAAEYTLEIEHCGGREEVEFTTLDAPGFPPELSEQPVAYRLDLSYGRIVTPDGLDGALRPLLTPHEWLVVFTLDGELEDGSLAMGGAAGNAQTQDTCVPTMELERFDLDGTAHVATGPTRLDLPFEGGDVTVQDLVFSATFAHEGGELSGVTLSGTLDLRQLVAFGTLGDSVEEICEGLLARDVTCAPCDDGAEACVDARWDSITAPVIDGLVVEEIRTPNCHPTCAESYTNPACNTDGWD